MAELDDIIHQPLRLKIMAALNALPAGAGLEFSRLKKLTGATDGNLGAHIETLAKAGYVARRQGLCRQEAADHGDCDSGGTRCVCPPRRDVTGNHRGLGAAAAAVTVVRFTRAPEWRWVMISPCSEGEFRATDSKPPTSFWLYRMHILLLGSGGREHALAWKIAASPLVTKLWCAPGNAGIAREAECVPLDIADHAAVIDFCRSNTIDFVVVGPDAPIAAGIVDDLTAAGFKAFGPTRAAGQLESSKDLHQRALQGEPYSDRRLWSLPGC